MVLSSTKIFKFIYQNFLLPKVFSFLLEIKHRINVMNSLFDLGSIERIEILKTTL